MTRNPILRLAIALFFVSALAACKKHQEKPNRTIYLAGNNGDTAIFWKNGTAERLSSGIGSSQANQVAVSGGNVYIAGNDLNAGTDVAALWKQGTPDFFPIRSGTLVSAANSVFISGSDVYAAGMEIIGGNLYATAWKNGTPAIIDSTNSAQCYAIAVSGGHTYICGTSLFNKGNLVATYWKDGARQPLTQGDVSYAYSICVSGGDVYIAGMHQQLPYSFPALWKNGQVTHLYNNNGVAKSVAVAGNDVYVGGYEDLGTRTIATIWKNGIAQQLPGGSETSSGASVFVDGSDVYVAGMVESNGIQQACYWKNGQLNIIGSAGSSANSIVVQ